MISNKRFFTLLAITLGPILLAIFAYDYHLNTQTSMHRSQRAKSSRLSADLRSLQTGILAYQADFGSLPLSIESVVSAEYIPDLFLKEAPGFIPQEGWFQRNAPLPPPRYHRFGNEPADWVVWYSFPSTDIDDEVRNSSRERITTLTYDPSNGTFSPGVVLRWSW